MKYIFSIPEHHQRYVQLDVQVNGPFDGKPVELRLPAWRPGRYELGNFAKNIKDFKVTDEKGNQIPFSKTSKDTWLCNPHGQSIHVTYQYYCAQWDAGACWLDHDQMYINPVHCCIYTDNTKQFPVDVELKIPDNWVVACGLPKAGAHMLKARDFDQLADSPFIASANIQHAGYSLNDISFNIWIQGTCNPDWVKILKDFEAFTRIQLDMMKDFPVKEYHFLVQILPHTFYHGVEHLSSTVLALGPGYKLMQPAMYKELLGVASHELFHVWNVKSIRPYEMLPYDFSRENYASTGYVYEGVTTYYGDLFLARSGFFNLKQLLDEYSVRFQKHMDNPGRLNYSVAESSFDTWLDGYVPGAPGRKVSIYDEGCLLAWVLDFMIRSATGSERSLDDVMVALYRNYALKSKGYTADDYRNLTEEIAGRSFAAFFNDYVYSATTLESLLSEVVSLAGISLKVTPAADLATRLFGIRTELRASGLFIASVFPGSPVQEAGLQKDDELIAFNEIRIENNLSDLISANTTNQEMKLLTCSSRLIRDIVLTPDGKNYYSKYTLEPENDLTLAQINFREKWLWK